MGTGPRICPETLEGPHLESPKWGAGRMATMSRALPQGWGVVVVLRHAALTPALLIETCFCQSEIGRCRLERGIESFL